jgi:chromosome segregation ATPase
MNEPEQEIKMSRNERRDRLRFFKKELKKHLKNKPDVNTSIDASDEELAQQQNNIKQWAVRHMNLKKKINTLSNGS